MQAPFFRLCIVLCLGFLALALTGLFRARSRTGRRFGYLALLAAVAGASVVALAISKAPRKPGPAEVRAALPGVWVGAGRWATDRVVISPDLKVVQTITEADGTVIERRGIVEERFDDFAIFDGISVPPPESLGPEPAMSTRMTAAVEGPLFRFVRGDGVPALIMRTFSNARDTDYVLVKRQP